MSSQTNRPLSPHLQVYKPQITSMSSILHRITGLLLSAFSVAWVIWLIALNRGPESLQHFNNIVQSIPGSIISIAAVWALFYHLANGIRHLIWDTGALLEIQSARRAGWVVIITSLLFTGVAIGVWI